MKQHTAGSYSDAVRIAALFCAKLNCVNTFFTYEFPRSRDEWRKFPESFQQDGTFPVRLASSIIQYAKTMFKKTPYSHVFVSRWAGILIPRIVVQKSDYFSRKICFDLSHDITCRLRVVVKSSSQIMPKHYTLHTVQRTFEEENKFLFVKFRDCKPLLQTSH